MSRFCDSLIFSIALWTLADNGAYLGEKSLAFAAGIFVLIIAPLLLGLRQLDLGTQTNISQRTGDCTSPSYSRPGRPTLVILGLATWFGYLIGISLFVVWIVFLLICIYSLLGERSDLYIKSEDERPGLSASERMSGRDLFLLGCLAVAAMMISSIGVRPNWDDAYYLNRAAVIASHPFANLPHYYTMFPGETTPFPYPTFPLLAYHDFIGIVAWITGLESFEAASYIIAPVGAMLMPIAYACLMRGLAPQIWIWLTISLFAVLATDASSYRFFSQFGFVWSAEGRSLLLNFAIPLAILYGIEFAARGRLYDFVKIVAVQISMCAFSSTAIWMGPVSVGIGLLTGYGFVKLKPWRVVIGTSASVYPMVVAAIAFSSSFTSIEYRYRPPALSPLIRDYLGESEFRVLLWLGICMMSPHLAPTRRLRVFLSVGFLVVFLTFLNPFLAEYFSRFVTSSVVFWRSMWLMPLGVAFASISTSLFASKNNRSLSLPIWFFTIALFVLYGPDRYILDLADSRRHVHDQLVTRTSFWKPSLKVNPKTYQSTLKVIAAVPEGSRIIAPERMAWFVTTFRKRVFPVAPRENVISHTLLAQQGMQEEYELYSYLLRYTDGEEEFDEVAIARVLRLHDISAFVAIRGVQNFDLLRSFLAGEGFELMPDDQYLVWIRRDVADPI